MTNSEEVSRHMYSHSPYMIQDVTAGVDSIRWNQLKQQHTDITSIQLLQTTNDMQVATLNVGGLGTSYMKVTDLCYQFAAFRLDVLCLQDTRQTEQEAPFITKIIKDLLPAGTEVRHAPLSSLGQGKRIGGQINIISPKWSSSICDFRKDPTGFGVLTGLYLQGRTQRLLIMSTYWPQRRRESESSAPTGEDSALQAPWLKLEDWIQTHRPYCKYDPLEYIQTKINRWAYAH